MNEGEWKTTFGSPGGGMSDAEVDKVIEKWKADGKPSPEEQLEKNGNRRKSEEFRDSVKKKGKA